MARSLLLALAFVMGSSALAAPSIELELGASADVTFTSTLLSFYVDTAGQGHALHRLAVANHGPTDVGIVSATQCIPIGSEITLHGDFPGGCPVLEDECAPVSPFFKAEARLPAVAAGEAASCLVRLDGPPYDAGPSITLAIEQLARSDGGSLIDPNPADNSAPLFLRAPIDVSVPTLSRVALVLLGAAVLMLGISQRARRGSGTARAARS